MLGAQDLRASELLRIFQEIDTNQDHRISRADFIEAVCASGHVRGGLYFTVDNIHEIP